MENIKNNSDKKVSRGRRKFGKTALAHALGGAMLSSAGCSTDVEKAEVVNSKPRKDTSDIKLSLQTNAAASDEDMLFFKQLGVEHVEVFVRNDEDQYDNLHRTYKRFKDAGLKIAGINSRKYWREETTDIIKLGLDGRDKMIEDFKILLRDMGRIGIKIYQLVGWQPLKATTYGLRGVERHLPCKEVDFKEIESHPAAYDRVYTQEEMWDNFTYFITRVMPAAEDNGIKIAMHTTIALPQLNGVGLIMNSFDSVKRGIEIAGSDNFGLIFCAGTWASGLKNGSFPDVVESIRYFGERNRIFHVHFRNDKFIDSPYTHYYETIVDNGSLDMYQIMKALKETGFKGTIQPEHIPRFADSSAGHGVGHAFSIGYMRALLQALDSEFYS